MAALATQILLWLWLGIFGFLLTRRVLRACDPWLTFGAAIPVALATVFSLFLGLDRLLGHPKGWVLAGIALFIATIVLYSNRESIDAQALEEFGFSPFQWAFFMSLLTAANFVLHTRQASGPGADYPLHFPVISLMSRGQMPPPDPYLYDQLAQGRFVSDYLVAILGWFNGGGEALLSTLWSFHHILVVSAFLLAFGLGRRLGDVAGGFFASSFLFFGASVGNGAGLMESFQGDTLLISTLMLLLVTLESGSGESRIGDAMLALVGAVYALTGGASALAALGLLLFVGPLVWRKPESGLRIQSFVRPTLVFLPALVLGISWGDFFGAAKVDDGLVVGIAVAAALAAVASLLWRRKSYLLKVLAAILALLVTHNGLRQVNQTLASLHYMPEGQARRAASVFYPSPRSWLLETERLHLSEDLLKAANSLRARSLAEDRMLSDLKTPDLMLESTVVALSGMRSVGHQVESKVEDLPLSRATVWEDFWRTGEARLLASLGARWLLTEKLESRSLLESISSVKRIEDFGSVTIWRYEGEFKLDALP